MTKQKLLLFIAWGCYLLGLDKLFYFLNRNRKRIICFHNILPDEEANTLFELGVALRASIFERQITHILKRFPCDTDFTNSATGTITFDDGYANQGEIADPILEKYGVRAYFFCPLTLLLADEPVGIDCTFMWFSFVEPGAYQLSLAGQILQFTIVSPEDRRHAWETLYQFATAQHLPFTQVRAALEMCVPFARIRAGIPQHYYTLRYQRIPDATLTAMKAYGHLIGAHSTSHEVYAFMSAEACRDDLAACGA